MLFVVFVVVFSSSSSKLKFELIRFFQLVFVLSINNKFGIGEHAQFAIMICYMHFPIIMHTTLQTQFGIRGQLEKVTAPLKLL